jgi:hypothetical protein
VGRKEESLDAAEQLVANYPQQELYKKNLERIQKEIRGE